MSKIIDNSKGSPLPSIALLLGYLLIAAGFVAFNLAPYLAIAVILLGGFISFTRNGIKLDPTTKKYKSYTSYFGIKVGNWESYEKYPYITIMSRRLSSTINTKIHSMAIQDIYFDVCLLTESHRQNILLKRTKDKDEAMAELEKLTGVLQVEPAAYDPVVSERTRNRRFQRERS